MDKNSKYIILIIILAVFLRVWTLNNPFYSDESIMPYGAADLSNGGFNFLIDMPGGVFAWNSPPLMPLVFRLLTWPFGVTNISMRLIIMLIGIANIFLTYKLAKRLFGENTGLVSALIMAVSFWHIIESYLLEPDGSLLMLFWLSLFLSYLRYEDTRRNGWIVLSGIILGLAALTKLTGALIMIALASYIFFQNRKDHEHLRGGIIQYIKIGLIGFFMFLVFPVLSLLFQPEYFYSTIEHSNVLSIIPPLFTPVRILIYLLLWATPLLLGPLIFSFHPGIWRKADPERKMDTRKKNLLYSWIFATLGFYLFTTYTGAVERYISVSIPPLCILAAALITGEARTGGTGKIKHERDDKYGKGFNFRTFFAVSAAAFLLLYMLNLIPGEWIVHNITDYLLRAMTFRWDFIFQFHGGTGPAFMTSFIPLGTALLLSTAVMIMMLIRPRKETFTVFLAIAFAFNAFLISSFIIGYPYPNIANAESQAVNYYTENADSLPSYVYSNDINIAWYLHKGESDFSLLDEIGTALASESSKDMQLRRPSTVIIKNYPRIVESNDTSDIGLPDYCTLSDAIPDRKMPIYYVYECI